MEDSGFCAGSPIWFLMQITLWFWGDQKGTRGTAASLFILHLTGKKIKEQDITAAPSQAVPGIACSRKLALMLVPASTDL